MMRSDQPLGFHSPRGEWGRRMEMNQPLGFHSLTESWIDRGWDRINHFVNWFN
jgi:hypothetical protein